MSTLRERLERLKKANGFTTDADLLREIYQYLYMRSEVKETEREFLRKAKGSFSSMIDEERDFDQRYFYPLEKALHTSAVYLIEGTGEIMEENEQCGLRYTASTDTQGNYQKLIGEGVYLEQDEYQCTLLDYMIDYEARNGFEFFAQRNELPLNSVCVYDRVGFSLDLSQRSEEQLVTTMLKVCKPETMLKYLNGFYFIENGTDPSNIDDYTKQDHAVLASWLVSNKALRVALSNYKRIPLSIANPIASRKDGKPLGESVFINYFFNLMVREWWTDLDQPEEEEHVTRDLFATAIELNKVAMASILDLGYPTYRLAKNGIVYADGIMCGSIVVMPRAEGLEAAFSPRTLEKYNELLDQIQGFQEKITEGSQMAIVGGEMRLEKQHNPDFYSFYGLMREKKVSCVAMWLQEEIKGKDRFRLPSGNQAPISGQGNPELFNQAIKVLSAIDQLSEESLGSEKTYAFPGLTNRSFFVDNERVTGIAPTKVIIGERYDNLAELLSSTSLAMPTYIAADGMVASVAQALKTYGVQKSSVSRALELMESYYLRSTATIDQADERGKSLIASAHQRALWLKLYKKEIISQFK